MCEARGIIREAHVAHHVEAHKGDKNKFYFGEIISLCRACHDGPVQQAEKNGFVRSRASVLDADRSAARGRDGGTMRECELYTLPQQQSERHYKLCYPANVRLELAVLDLQLQHTGLRKSG